MNEPPTTPGGYADWLTEACKRWQAGDAAAEGEVWRRAGITIMFILGALNGLRATLDDVVDRLDKVERGF